MTGQPVPSLGAQRAAKLGEDAMRALLALVVAPCNNYDSYGADSCE
jgi:hypothetical protein